MSDEEEFLRKAKEVAERAGLDLEEVLEMVNEIVEMMDGFVKPEGALSLVANELGVPLEEGNALDRLPSIKIGSLVPGMRRTVVIGKVVRVYGTFPYVNRSGEPSERAEFRIADDTGEIDVVVWSKSLVDMVKEGKLKEGDVVRITNARVGQRFDRISLQLDSGAEIEVLPSDRFPELGTLSGRRKVQVDELYDMIGEEVDFEGTVIRIFPPSEFTRRDGSSGVRASIILRDDSGNTVRLVLWGSISRIVEELTEGSKVLVRDVRVVSREDEPELHTTHRSTVQILSEAEGSRIRTVLVLHMFKPERIGITGERRFMDLLVEEDGSLYILRVWGEWIDELEGERPPFTIRAGPLYRLDERVFSLSRSGRVEVLERRSDRDVDAGKLARIIKYRRSWIGECSDGYRELRGTVVQVSDYAKVSWFCPTCGSKVAREYGKFFCERCGEIDEAKPLLHLFFLLDDGTGVAQVHAFRDRAESLLGMSTEEVIVRADQLGELGDSIPLDELASKLVGSEVVVRGRATFLESGMVKLVMDELEEADPLLEGESLVNSIEDTWLEGKKDEDSDG